MNFIVSLITSLVAFFLAFVGADIAGEKNRKSVRAIALLIGTLAALVSIYQGIFRFLIIMPAGNVGVVETLGKISDQPLNPGIHWVIPFANVVEFSTRIKDIKETVSTTSSEGLNFNLDVSLQYKIDPQKVVQVYQTIGTDEKEIVISRFRSIIRQITANYEANAIVGEKRQEIAQRLREELSVQLTSLGFIVEETLLRDVILPETIQAAIQQKLKAEQESKQMQFELEKARQQMQFELEKARKEAERQKIEAQGTAEAQRLRSQGITEQLLKLKAIEATQSLAVSPNTKVIIIGGGKEGLPLILQQAE